MNKLKMVYPGNDKYKEKCEALEESCNWIGEQIDTEIRAYECDSGIAVYMFDREHPWGEGYLACSYYAIDIMIAVQEGDMDDPEPYYELLSGDMRELGFPAVLSVKSLYGIDLDDGMTRGKYESIARELPYEGQLVEVSFPETDNAPSYVFNCEASALRWLASKGFGECVELCWERVGRSAKDRPSKAYLYPPYTNSSHRWHYVDFDNRDLELHEDGTTSPWEYTWRMLVGDKLDETIPTDLLFCLQNRGY